MRIKDIPNASSEEILHNLMDVLTNVKNGHFTARMMEGFPGPFGEVAKLLNAHLDMLGQFSAEHHRLMEEIGVTGRLGGQMEVADASGEWQRMIDDVNRMGGNVTGQFRDAANVVYDILKGDLTARSTAQCIRGEFAAFRQRLNQLADEFEQRSADVVKA